MRVFVLSTGRSGTTTFAKACSFIENYSSGHESRANRIEGRLDYPDNHIETDNRISWFLGTLDKLYGTDPLYVYLHRNRDEVVRSYARRFRGPMSIVRAMANGILERRHPPQSDAQWAEVAALTVDTVTDNIEAFLRDKPNMIEIALEDIEAGFEEMWDRIGAEGDIDAAYAELQRRHNATPKSKRNW